jgi:hypothetical protein
MKPVVAFIVAFVVATAGSAGAKVMLTKQAPPAAATKADSASHAEETSTDTAVVASGQPVTAPVDTAVHAVAPSAPDTSKHASAAVKTPAPGTAPSVPVQTGTVKPGTVKPGTAPVGAPKIGATRAANDSVTEASERRVAKVFTSMDAKQAAKVLEHMTDNDVHVILGYVGPRQAASIMAALPPERVAKLSKLAMQGTK